MILCVETEREGKSASRGISGNHDLFRIVFFFIQKPFVGIDCILECRRKRMLRCDPVVRSQDIRPEPQFRIFNRKPPVNVLHRTDISAAVELQDHPPSDRLLRL